MKKVKTVAEYIAAAPREKRTALSQLRKTIRATAPKAIEQVRYDMVGYMQDGKPLIHFAYWKDHYALYGSFDALARELERYDTSGKGTVRFPADELLPYGLITKMVKANLAVLKKAR